MRYKILRWFRGAPDAREPAVNQIFVSRGVAETAKARLQADFPDLCFAIEGTPARCALGTLVVAPDALAAIKDAGQTPMDFFGRHAMDNLEQIEAIEAAGDLYFTIGARISSFHKTRKDVGLHVLTEVDRLTTTISLRNGC